MSSMGSTNHWDATWHGLPGEIRLLILNILLQDGCSLSLLATVSREWQAEVERYNFSRIRLTPSRLVDFGPVIHSNRPLVGYIWLCWGLDDDDCIRCAPPTGGTADEQVEAYNVIDINHCHITTAFQNLFSALSTWEPDGDLMLDISIHSPSDSKDWSKYLAFLPDTPADMGNSGTEQMMSNTVYDNSRHGWAAGVRDSDPPRTAIAKVFHSGLEEGPFDSEHLLLRQQNRRRWMPTSLAHVFARFPRLQEVHYEPWREWCSVQRRMDRGYEYLLKSVHHFNNHLQRLVVFKNFNQQYPSIMQRFQFGVCVTECGGILNPSRTVTRVIAVTSLRLEHLTASFIVDARHFFAIEASWDGKSSEIGAMLQTAAAAAMKMPQLETTEIWNGRKGLAALFKYQVSRERQQARSTWRGTWELAMEPSMIKAWEALVRQRYAGWELDLVRERLDEDAIKSHGDAIHHPPEAFGPSRYSRFG
ncbi:hypothetical protein J3F83DRAFT_763559 [Trichoderma novae-zelandiae]